MTAGDAAVPPWCLGYLCYQMLLAEHVADATVAAALRDRIAELGVGQVAGRERDPRTERGLVQAQLSKTAL